METVLKVVPSQLSSFKERKVSLKRLKLTRQENKELDSRSKQLLKDVEQLVRELTDFRFEHPEFAKPVMLMEIELLDAFPEANPDR